MIDTHSHLFEEEFKLDIEQCINRCRDSGVEKIILVGFSDETNLSSQMLASKYDIFYPTAGVHPSEAQKNYLDKFNRLVEFVNNNKVYAIGECGLDYYWDKSFINEQKELFRLQIELAIKLDLPIIIHMRDASQDTYDILSRYKGKIKGVMHCYSGSHEMALRFIDLGFYISLGGPLTFKNAKEPKEVLKSIPLDRILFETDCPYLAPTSYRGKRNESSYVSLIYKYASELLEIDEIDLINQVRLNCNKLFRI